jgi:hypothetical protein
VLYKLFSKSRIFSVKKIFLPLCFIGISITAISAQLSLEKVNSKKIKTIPNGTEIMLKFPIKTTKTDCNCYLEYTGKLVSASKDSLTMIIYSDERLFVDEYGVSRTIYQLSKYPEGKEVSSIVKTENLMSLKYISDSKEAVNALGGVLLILATLNQFVISPFYSPEVRKTSDKVTWGAFGVGLTLALLPKTKTYHFKQPKNGNKTLWQFKP